MLKKSLITILSVALFISLSSVSFSFEPALPDLSVEELIAVPFDQEDLDFRCPPDDDNSCKIINISGDQTYYDYWWPSNGRINRSYSFEVVIRNGGTTDYAPTWQDGDSDANFDYAGFGHSIYNNIMADAFSSGYSSYLEAIPAGTNAVKPFNLDISLSEVSGDEFCVDVYVDMDYNHFLNEWTSLGKVVEADEENNSYTRCFTQDYDFADTPSNLHITAVSDDEFTVEWDASDDADYYSVRPYESVGVGESLAVQETTDTTATISFVSDRLHCVHVYGVKDEYLGNSPSSVCYSKSLPAFDDVEVSAWYFGYLQKMQEKGIIAGYSDAVGNPTGEYGAVDSLTVAECLKIVIASMDISLDADGESLPSSLNSHWAKDYFKKGADLDLTILTDLDGVDPNRAVKRGEILEMFWDAMQVSVSSASEYTASDISDTPWADEIQFAYDLNIVSGHPDGTFKPYDSVNRAEITKIAAEMMDHFDK